MTHPRPAGPADPVLPESHMVWPPSFLLSLLRAALVMLRTAFQALQPPLREPRFPFIRTHIEVTSTLESTFCFESWDCGPFCILWPRSHLRVFQGCLRWPGRLSLGQVLSGLFSRQLVRARGGQLSVPPPSPPCGHLPATLPVSALQCEPLTPEGKRRASDRCPAGPLPHRATQSAPALNLFQLPSFLLSLLPGTPGETPFCCPEHFFRDPHVRL